MDDLPRILNGPLRLAVLIGLVVAATSVAAFAADGFGTASSASLPPAQAAGPTRPPETGKGAGAGKEAGASKEAIALYMPDGQLKTHMVRVFVDRNIQQDQKPTLRLFRSHALTKKDPHENDPHQALFVAPNQVWMQTVAGTEVRQTGTIMLFDLSGMSCAGKAMARVTPVVSWTEGGAQVSAVGVREVNVGNIGFAILYTVIAVGLAVALVIILARGGGGRPLALLSGADGHLALSQAQIVCWTVVVGGVVFAYGLIRLEIPPIPDSLVVLMGTSLITGGVGYFKDAEKHEKRVAAGQAPPRRDLRFGDLVREYVDGVPELSLSKAQMLFWTLLLLALFVAKSGVDGVIWDIPWQLVALMGFSQAGYLAPKIVKAGDSKPPVQANPVPAKTAAGPYTYK